MSVGGIFMGYQIKRKRYPEDIVLGNIWDLEDYKGKRGTSFNSFCYLYYLSKKVRQCKSATQFEVIVIHFQILTYLIQENYGQSKCC